MMGYEASLPLRSECACPCHSNPGIIHFAPCCRTPEPAQPAESPEARALIADILGVHVSDAAFVADGIFDFERAVIKVGAYLAASTPRPTERGAVEGLSCRVPMGSYDAQVELVPPDFIRREDGRGICVDACLALEITQLWKSGIRTTGCCCGHGIAPPYIGVTSGSAARMVAMGYRPAAAGDTLAFSPRSTCHLPATDQAAEVERLRADIANLHDLDGSATCDECGAPLFDSDETDTDEAEVLALCAGHVRPGEPIYSYRVAATDQAAEVDVEALVKKALSIATLGTPGEIALQIATNAVRTTIDALATQPATGRTMGGEDGLRAALEDIETMLTPNGNVWTGTEPKWQTDAYARARAALQKGGE